GADEIRIFYEGECIANHKRCWQLHQWIMDIYHYLKTFERKSGALAQSECLSQAPHNLKNIYDNYYIGKEKSFLELLQYIRKNNQLDKILKAVTQLEKNHMVDITTEKIIFIAEQSDPPLSVRTNSEDDVTAKSLK